MPNPDFDGDALGHEDSAGESGSSGAKAEVGDGDPGDGDPGDGDPATTDPGDGDPGDGDPGDGDPGDGDPGDGDPADPECVEPSGGFLAPCSGANPLCDVGVCVLPNNGPVEDATPGLCTWACQSAEDCAWGSMDQCVDDAIQCVPISIGEQQLISVCAVPCELEMDCSWGQLCHFGFGVCLPQP